MHIPVLLKESIDWLHLNSKKWFVDWTLWLWWHSKYLFETNPNIKIIWIDQDSDNIEKAKINLDKFSDRLTIIKDNFCNIESIIEKLKLNWKIDWILLDLWLASTHIDIDDRGFSFKKDWPLDMRMNKTQILTAETIVNTYHEIDLSEIFKQYWEEPRAKAIASEIVKMRKVKKIKTTFELSDIIKNVKKDFNKHPATLVFQALRIEVNNEIDTLKQAMTSSVNILSKWWHIAVISYHSLEDRIVKNAFKYEQSDCICSKLLPMCQCKKIRRLEIITKKPIITSMEEIKKNLRSRSAKLRIAKKII